MTKGNNQQDEAATTELTVKFQGEVKLLVRPAGQGLDIIMGPEEPDARKLWAAGRICITVEDSEPESGPQRAPSARASSKE